MHLLERIARRNRKACDFENIKKVPITEICIGDQVRISGKWCMVDDFHVELDDDIYKKDLAAHTSKSKSPNHGTVKY